MIGSTCFRHFYSHHQELTTIVLITTWAVRFLGLLLVGSSVQAGWISVWAAGYPAARTLTQPACTQLPTNSNPRNRTAHVVNSTIGLDRPRGFQEVKVPRFRDNDTGWW